MGSNAYGLANKDSDLDITEVFEETTDQIFGLHFGKQKMAQISDGENDIRRYTLKHWASLCARGNPNAIETAFVREDLIQTVDPVFEFFFLKDPTIFLFRDPLVNSHLGFAKSQLKKLKNAKDLGRKRKDLVKKYGYDVKYAAHCYRLLWQLKLFFTVPDFRLPYNQGVEIDRILEIKSGTLKFEEFMALYNEFEAEVTDLVDHNPAPEWISEGSDHTELNRRLYRYYKENLL